ncbi:MAG: hypothetical protein AAF798_19255 [Bacteroidota bacterium]
MRIDVKAKENSISGGTAKVTGLKVAPGDYLTITCAPTDVWKAGTSKEHTSNANGIPGKLYPINGSEQKFVVGSLIGSLDGGKTYFGIGTSLQMTIVTQGELTLAYMDINNNDNSGMVTAIAQVYKVTGK